MADEKPKNEEIKRHRASSAPSPAALKAEIAELEKQIAEKQAEVVKLQQQANYQEFPKHVTVDGVTMEFASREAQDAAGPKWADK